MREPGDARRNLVPEHHVKLNEQRTGSIRVMGASPATPTSSVGAQGIGPKPACAAGTKFAICWGGRIRTSDWLIQSQVIEIQFHCESFRTNSRILMRERGRSSSESGCHRKESIAR